jgi:hypothetical protein
MAKTAQIFAVAVFAFILGAYNFLLSGACAEFRIQRRWRKMSLGGDRRQLYCVARHWPVRTDARRLEILCLKAGEKRSPSAGVW